MGRRRVVVTGLGVLASNASSANELSDALRPQIEEIAALNANTVRSAGRAPTGASAANLLVNGGFEAAGATVEIK